MTPAETGFVFVIFNVALWLLVIVVQEILSRTGRLPRRRTWRNSSPFLYFQDWHMATWGDWIGLTLIDWVAGYYFLEKAGTETLVPSILIGLFGTGAFHYRRLHHPILPEAGYPSRGKTSLQGYMHLVYFLSQSSTCAFVSLLALTSALHGTFLVIAIFGGAVYIASYLKDLQEGKLKPLSVH